MAVARHKRSIKIQEGINSVHTHRRCDPAKWGLSRTPTSTYFFFFLAEVPQLTPGDAQMAQNDKIGNF